MYNNITNVSDFLEEIHLEQDWIGAVITTNNKIFFETIDKDSAIPFTQQWQSNNIYYHLNDAEDKSSKPREHEIVLVRGLHIDLDAPRDMRPSQAKPALLDKLRKYAQQPSFIVDTGNGYQAVWLFNTPLVIGEDASASDIRGRNKALATALGGDHCYDLGRLLRLPFTTNHPNATKQKHGRVKVSTKLVEFSGKRYNLSDFEFEEATLSTEGPWKVRYGPPEEIDLSKLKEDYIIPPETLEVILTGTCASYTGKFDSDSDHAFRAAMSLHRLRVKPEVIKGLLTNPDLEISRHYYRLNRTRDPEIQADKTVAESFDKVEAYIENYKERIKDNKNLSFDEDKHYEHLAGMDSTLQEMNSKYALLNRYGIESFVMAFDPDGNFEKIIKIATMKTETMTERVPVFDDTTGRVKMMRAGDWWMDNPQRREYKEMVFAPGEDMPANVYNAWQGFAIQPKSGEWNYIQVLLHDILCDGNDTHYNFLLDWLAASVQNLGQPCGCAVAIHGPKGVGKSTLGTIMGKIFGSAYLTYTDSTRVFDRFNNDLENACFVMLDEAYASQYDKKFDSQLKGMITEPNLVIEAKYVAKRVVRNNLNLLIVGNDEHIVPASLNERRFFVLGVSDYMVNLKKDKPDTFYKFYKELYEEINGDGVSAFFDVLLKRDLSDYNKFSPPMTEPLMENQINNMPIAHQWLGQVLSDGLINTTDEDFYTFYANVALRESFLEFVRQQGTYYDKTIGERAFIKRVAEIIPLKSARKRVQYIPLKVRQSTAWLLNRNEIEENIDIQQHRGWEFPPLEECRKAFTEHYPIYTFEDNIVTSTSQEETNDEDDDEPDF